jgi:hypothetical protein
MAFNESVRISHLRWSDKYNEEKPYQIFVPLKLPEGLSTTNLSFESDEDTTIIDVRGRQNEFSLDVHGFQYIEHNWKFNNFDDANLIQEKYLDEVIELLMETIQGIERIEFFDWRVRKFACMAVLDW